VVTIADKTEADTMWEYNMMAELEVSQHNMCNCSITALGDILFVNTSNGLDESHLNLPSPDAPSFIAMDKNTGEVLWKDGSPAAQILHGQWSSPTIALLDGVAQVIFAGGDGWVYSFKANGGADGAGELLWKFDANPKTSKWILGGRGTRNNLIATPVVYSGQVYIAVGQDPEHGEGVGHLWCIEPSKRGDVSPELAVDVASGKTIDHQRLQAVVEEDGQIARDNPNSAVIWHYSDVDRDGDGDIGFEEQMHRSCGTVAIKNDLLYISDFSGLLHCLNAQTGEVHFTYDMFAAAWGSPLIVDGHVFIGDEDGDIAIFDLAADATEPIKEINMGNSIYSTPIIANGTLFIANKTHLFAIEAPASE
jgi:outer membrane protein assembly factor BamB